jgi:hypothetical protein
VLIAGFASPTFAQLLGSSSTSSSTVFTPTHGNIDQSFTGPFNGLGGVEPAFIPSGQTFIPTASNLVGVDVFAASIGVGTPGPDTVTVNVWDTNQPGVGNLLGSSSVNIDTTGTSIGTPLTVHLDFTSIPLIPGNTYALQFVVTNPDTTLEAFCDFIGGVDNYPNGITWQRFPVPQCDWGFVTYFGDDTVGGEFLQIDSAVLLIAGLQTSAIWILPVLAGTTAVGAYYIKTRMNKDIV